MIKHYWGKTMNKWFAVVKTPAFGERKLCDTCHKQRITPSATSKGTTTCATCVRRSGKGRVGFNKRSKKE